MKAHDLCWGKKIAFRISNKTKMVSLSLQIFIKYPLAYTILEV